MDLPFFLVDDLVTSNTLTLNEDTSKHVVQVLRMKPQEQLRLTDGVGNSAIATIISDHKKACTVAITDRHFTERKQQSVSIAISLLKNVSRLEWFLEKATEIGVTEFIPLVCERTEKQHFRLDRMKQIVVSAMLQSQRVWLPVLHEPTPFATAVAGEGYQQKLIAHCDEGTKLFVKDFASEQSLQVFIGPEGDFSKAEIMMALQHNCLPVSLGANRLRTETAGVVAAACLCI